MENTSTLSGFLLQYIQVNDRLVNQLKSELEKTKNQLEDALRVIDDFDERLSNFEAQLKRNNKRTYIPSNDENENESMTLSEGKRRKISVNFKFVIGSTALRTFKEEGTIDGHDYVKIVRPENDKYSEDYIKASSIQYYSRLKNGARKCVYLVLKTYVLKEKGYVHLLQYHLENETRHTVNYENELQYDPDGDFLGAAYYRELK